MHTSQATHLFQSDASLAQGRDRAAKAQRTASGAEHGSPIWLGMHGSAKLDGSDAPPSIDMARLAERAAGADGGVHKVIAAHRPNDTSSPFIWTAESGRVARCTHLETGRVVQLVSGHAGPVSGLATWSVSDHRAFVCTASWDRCIRIWPVLPGKRPPCLVKLDEAGADLLKALCVDPVHCILYAGGNDKTVRAWNLAPLSKWAHDLDDAAWAALATVPAPCPVPTVRGALQGQHTRPIVCISTLPPPPHGAVVANDVPEPGTVFSADSMGRVLQVTPHLSVVRELNGHETSVNDIKPVWREEDDTWMAHVWTASSDQSVRCFPLSLQKDMPARWGARSSHAGDVLGSQPPVYATHMIPVPCKAHAVLPLRDETVLIGMEDGTLQVYRDDQPEAALDGHWHNVTYAGLWTTPQAYVVTASLDGTVRRWPLSMLEGHMPETPAAAALTAEEEAELAELMEGEV